MDDKKNNFGAFVDGCRRLSSKFNPMRLKQLLLFRTKQKELPSLAFHIPAVMNGIFH